MPRTAPARTPEQQEDADRRAALRAGTVQAARAFAEQYGLELLGTDDQVEQSLHEARALDRTMPAPLRKTSRAWLREHHPESVALKVR